MPGAHCVSAFDPVCKDQALLFCDLISFSVKYVAQLCCNTDVSQVNECVSFLLMHPCAWDRLDTGVARAHATDYRV